MTNARKRYNSIDRLKIGGEEVVQASEIKKAMVDCYKNLYRESETSGSCFNFPGGQKINEEEREW